MMTTALRAESPRAKVKVRIGAAAVLSSVFLACGGGQTTTNEPDDIAILEQPSDEQAASSDEVKKAIDLIKAEKFVEARGILETETKSSPDDPQAAFYLGVALEHTDDADGAVIWYRKAIELDPKVLDATHNLSALLLEKEDFEGALKVVEDALKIAPEEPGLLANRAIALDMLQKPEAVGAYEAYLKAQPDDQANRFNYAVVLAVNERPDDAKKALAGINTKETSLLGDMGALYMKLGDPAGCIKLWDSALSTEKSAEGLVHRARCKLGSNDKKGGIADLNEAVTTNPNSSVAHFYLGSVLKKEGKAAEGKKHLEKAVEVGSGDEFAQAAQAQLSK